jgi:hypothetical protein
VTAEERLAAARAAAAQFDAEQRDFRTSGRDVDHVAWAHRLRGELVSAMAVLAAREQEAKAPQAALSDDAVAAILAAALADAIAFREDAAASTSSGPDSAQEAFRARQEHQDQADRYRALARQLGLWRRE